MKQKDLFLVAYYHMKPKDPKRTKEAGYMSNLDNIDYTESINITRGLKARDQQTAKVILNMSKQSVVANRFNDNKDFPSLLAHYQESYPQYINPLLAMMYPDEVATEETPAE